MALRCDIERLMAIHPEHQQLTQQVIDFHRSCPSTMLAKDRAQLVKAYLRDNDLLYVAHRRQPAPGEEHRPTYGDDLFYISELRMSHGRNMPIDIGNGKGVHGFEPKCYFEATADSRGGQALLAHVTFLKGTYDGSVDLQRAAQSSGSIRKLYGQLGRHYDDLLPAASRLPGNNIRHEAWQRAQPALAEAMTRCARPFPTATEVQRHLLHIEPQFTFQPTQPMDLHMTPEAAARSLASSQPTPTILTAAVVDSIQHMSPTNAARTRLLLAQQLGIALTAKQERQLQEGAQASEEDGASPQALQDSPNIYDLGVKREASRDSGFFGGPAAISPGSPPDSRHHGQNGSVWDTPSPSKMARLSEPSSLSLSEPRIKLEPQW